MNIYELIIKAKKTLKINNNDLGEMIGKSGDTLRKALSRKSLSDFELMVILKTILTSEKYGIFSDTDIFKSLKQYHDSIIKENTYAFNESLNLNVNEPREIFQTKSGNNIEELSNSKFLLTVPMVPYKAHATYISEYLDAEYISDLTKVSFIVDRVPRGKYMAFEIQNDSMNDATLEHGPSRDAILNGDVVLGRELGKQHWYSKLNTNGYPYWIIVHKDTIVCKEIINHDVEKGIITCHSLNSSPEFQDFDLKLDDCHQLFNIIKKQI